jgi:hypothetical protein
VTDDTASGYGLTIPGTSALQMRGCTMLRDDPESLAAALRNSAGAMDGCMIEGGQVLWCEHGQSLRVNPGGSVTGGTLNLFPGGRIVALEEGGFVIGPCSQCP